MKLSWKWFWIAIAVFGGSSRTYQVDRLVNVEINTLTKLCVILIVLSGLFIIYFILDKLGLVDYLNQKLT